MNKVTRRLMEKPATAIVLHCSILSRNGVSDKPGAIQSDYGRMIGGSFRECLGGFAACGLLRKNFPQSSALS
jgi:hypothetical protein